MSGHSELLEKYHVLLVVFLLVREIVSVWRWDRINQPTCSIRYYSYQDLHPAG
jgi:hypothetical protein